MPDTANRCVRRQEGIGHHDGEPCRARPHHTFYRSRPHRRFLSATDISRWYITTDDALMRTAPEPALGTPRFALRNSRRVSLTSQWS